MRKEFTFINQILNSEGIEEKDGKMLLTVENLQAINDDIIKDAPYSFKSNKLVREFLSKAKENMKLIEEHKRLEENASVKK